MIMPANPSESSKPSVRFVTSSSHPYDLITEEEKESFAPVFNTVDPEVFFPIYETALSTVLEGLSEGHDETVIIPPLTAALSSVFPSEFPADSPITQQTANLIYLCVSRIYSTITKEI